MYHPRLGWTHVLRRIRRIHVLDIYAASRPSLDDVRPTQDSRMRGDASRGRKSFMFESKFCQSTSSFLQKRRSFLGPGPAISGRVLVRLRPGHGAIGGAMVVRLAVRSSARALVR